MSRRIAARLGDKLLRNPRIPASLRAEVRAELARRDLRVFIRDAWPYVDSSHFEPSWHIDAIAEHLTALLRGEIRNLIVNIPPRHGKSLIAAVLFPAWIWLQRPGFRILSASYSATLAKEHAVAARNLIRSPWYESLNRGADGQPLFRLKTKGEPETEGLKDTEELYTNSALGRRVAVGVGGAATGRGGDLVLIDDPHNPKQALSDAERQHALTWSDRTISTRLDDPRTGRKLLIMQRLHQRDMTGHWLAKPYEGEIKPVLLKIPAEFNPARRTVTSIGWTDPRVEAGELIGPRFGRQEIATLRVELGSVGAAGQLDQEPAPEGGAIVKRHWIKRWTSLPVRFDRVVISWDLAFGGDDTSSYCVGQVWGFDGANAYLLDQIRDQLEFPEQLKAFLSQAQSWGGKSGWPGAHLVPEKIIENKANGAALVASAKATVPGCIPCNPRGDKAARLRAVSPGIESGNVYVPATGAWVEEWFDELTMFPGTLHKDQVDACSQALARVWLPEDGEDETAAAQQTEALAAW